MTYNPPRGPSAGIVLATIVSVLVIVGVILSGIAYTNPSANMPIISPVVCSLRGATWYDGGILDAPGCYESVSAP